MLVRRASCVVRDAYKECVSENVGVVFAKEPSVSIA